MAGQINDISIATGIIIVFIALGIILPYVNTSFGVASSTQNIRGFQTNIGSQSGSIIGLGTIFLSILGMFFWTFGALPWFIDFILFLPMRIMLVMIIVRNFPVIGSGGG
jgi:hypothetical protein